MSLNPDVAKTIRAQESKICHALREGGTYSLSRQSQSDTDQSWEPVSPCIRRWMDSAIFRVCYATYDVQAAVH